jgi:tripartite-type tricarboxylate transporter receptor subunit TctC
MRLPDRRRFIGLMAGALSPPAFSEAESAGTYPSGPVRIIAPYAPGGSVDFHARLMAQWLSERFGQQFVVENRPGAGSNIGTEIALRAPADGRILLLAAPANAINATLYDRLGFDFLRDAAPVGGFIRGYFTMVVHPSHPANSVAEFIAHAKANPGKTSMGSAGLGSANHLFGELFNTMTGIKTVHVPYRGEALALTDVISRQVDLLYVSGTVSGEQVKAGSVKALGVTTAERSSALPTVPTIGETVHGYEAGGWAGMVAPRGTPPEIIAALNRQINAGLASPRIKTRYEELGLKIIAGSPEDFGKLIADETEKWGKVIRAANIRAE